MPEHHLVGDLRDEAGASSPTRTRCARRRSGCRSLIAVGTPYSGDEVSPTAASASARRRAGQVGGHRDEGAHRVGTARPGRGSGRRARWATPRPAGPPRPARGRSGRAAGHAPKPIAGSGSADRSAGDPRTAPHHGGTTTSVTASSPAATRNVVCAPPTNTSRAASAGAVPAGTTVPRLAVPNTVTSTARPRDAPTCCITLTSPEAAPACSGCTPCSAAPVSGTNAVPLPRPTSTSGPSTPGSRCPATAGSATAGRSATARCRRAITARSPNRSTSTRALSWEDANRPTVIGRNAEAGRQRGVAEHVLQELGEEEEHPDHAGHQQQPGDVRAAAAAVGEQTQRRDRRRRAQLDETKATSSSDARRRRRPSVSVAPAVAAARTKP